MDVIEEEFGRRWRWHDIRAAYITQGPRRQAQWPAQALARHSDFRTTQGYIGLSDQGMRDCADMAALRPSLALLKGGKP